MKLPTLGRIALAVLLAVPLLFLASPTTVLGQDRDPGDLNLDGACNLTDVVYLLEFLYENGPPPVPILDPPVVRGRLIANGPIEPMPRIVRLVLRHGATIQEFETTTHPDWGTFEFPVPIDGADWILVYLADPTEPGNTVMCGVEACEGAPIELHVGALSIGSSMTIEDLSRLDATTVGDPTGAILFDWNHDGQYLELAEGTGLHIDGCSTLWALRSAVPGVGDLVIEPGASLVTNHGLLVCGDLLLRGTLETAGSALWLAGCETTEVRTGSATLPPVIIDKEIGTAVHLESQGPLEISGELIINSGRLEVGTEIHIDGASFLAGGAELEIRSAAESVSATFEGPVMLAPEARMRVNLPFGSLNVGPSIQVLAGATIELRGAVLRPLRIRPLRDRSWAFVVDPAAILDVTFVDVAHSDARDGRYVPAASSIDSGLNLNWKFLD